MTATAAPPPARDALNVSQTISEALAIEMQRDERVLLLGEDVARNGGVFGCTRGLLERFGEDRVRDTPISEMGFTGMAVGLAMAGFRPVVEIMFVDFIGVCLEQVYNAIAKIPYMSGGGYRMPVVIKTAGGLIGSAAQHSQCLWGLFAHLPGLQVVAPSTPFDYRGLMASAVETDNPVVYIEHKGLLLKKGRDFRNQVPVPEARYKVPIGKARVVRPGGDVSLVTLSAGVEHALEAAEVLAAEGIDVDVIDLRSVVPLDMETVTQSVTRTGRLLVVDEDYLSFGLTGEVITRTIEALGPSALQAVARHAVPDVPIPAARSLEQAVVPGAGSIAAAVRRLVA